MGFTEAVKSVFAQYATFNGRASRSEYWWFFLFNFLCSFVLSFVGTIFILGGGDATSANALSWIYSIAVFLPSLAVMVRRLHDTTRSGWNVLWSLLPVIGWILLIVYLLGESKPDNQYGPQPLR